MPPEVRSLGPTLERWRDHVVAWHEAKVTNGPTEAINNLIKRIKHIGFGLRRFRHYRARALLYAGKPNWNLLATVTPRRNPTRQYRRSCRPVPQERGAEAHAELSAQVQLWESRVGGSSGRRVLTRPSVTWSRARPTRRAVGPTGAVPRQSTGWPRRPQQMPRGRGSNTTAWRSGCDPLGFHGGPEWRRSPL